MSSMERAPEPTMEEILASIRRIISEDESNSARPRSAAASSRDDEGLEAPEGEADDKIISDIARVLSGAQQTPAEEEEDILDLTSELGGLEIVEETVSLEVIEEAIPAEALAEPEAVAMPVETPESEAEASPELAQPEPMPESIPEPIAEPQMQAPEPAIASVPPSPMTASEEAASALERAIAALRAGQLPTSISEFAPQPQAQAEPQPAPFYVAPQPEPQPAPFYVAPEPEPQPEPQAFAAPESEPEPEFQPEPEAELVLTEFETEAVLEEPASDEAAAEAEAPPAWESETAPWTGAPEPFVEPERHLTNGHSAEHKTLEDSVKDMLRPMLRQWLDENMPRMVSAALKDEFKDNPARFQRD